MDIELHSDKRAEERALFEESLREKERRQKEYEKKMDEDRNIREQQEIADLRKNMLFKARPLPRCCGKNKEMNWKDENKDPNTSSMICDESTIMETEESGIMDEEMADAL